MKKSPSAVQPVATIGSASPLSSTSTVVSGAGFCTIEMSVMPPAAAVYVSVPPELTSVAACAGAAHNTMAAARTAIL